MTDTTSRVFGIGKTAPIKNLKSYELFRKQGTVSSSEGASQKDIIESGEKALVTLYGGQCGDSLDTLHLQLFHQKVSSSTFSVQPCSLPPTKFGGGGGGGYG